MARREERRKAIELRLQGKSYSEIRSELGLAKSTLSDWLKKHPLTEDQIARIKADKPRQIEKFRKTMAMRREARLGAAYIESQRTWLPLTEREILLAGIFLYWGEGTKVSPSYLCISNCDPRVIKFALFWMTKSLGIEKKQIRILLHLYSDMSIGDESQYWSKILGLTEKNFRKPFIKQSTRAGLTYKSFGHGTCNIYVSNTQLKDKVIQSINAISNRYAEVV